MSKIALLRERRNAKAIEANALNAKYPSADQRMPNADAATLDALLAEIEAVDVDIRREAQMADLAAKDSKNKAPNAPIMQNAVNPTGGGVQMTAQLRMNPDFAKLCTRLGLARYWRDTDQWPDCASQLPYDFKEACT